MFVDINKISKLEIVIASNRKNENIYEEIFCTQIFYKPFELGVKRILWNRIFSGIN